MLLQGPFWAVHNQNYLIFIFILHEMPAILEPPSILLRNLAKGLNPQWRHTSKCDKKFSFKHWKTVKIRLCRKIIYCIHRHYFPDGIRIPWGPLKYPKTAGYARINTDMFDLDGIKIMSRTSRMYLTSSGTTSPPNRD